jgi:hypothetical protein
MKRASGPSSSLDDQMTKLGLPPRRLHKVHREREKVLLRFKAERDGDKGTV